MSVTTPERRSPILPSPATEAPAPRRSRRATVAFWLVAAAAGAAAVPLETLPAVAAGVGVAALLLPWLGLRERSLWLLNAAVLATMLAEGLWLAMGAATLALLVVPGLLLLDAAGLSRQAMLRFPPYLPAASVVALAAAGVLANGAGPPLGVDRPLATGPVLAALDALLAALALAASLRAPQAPLTPAGVLMTWPRVRDAWPLLLPAAAAIGAAALTASDDRGIALATLVASLVTLGYGLLLAGRGEVCRAGIALFGATLACIYSFTLPGAEVFGWDITGEYATLADVLATGHWSRVHERDAYGAMLSLTLVPAALHALAGLSPAVILKAVYPALLALFPVGVFTVARRVVAPRYAYVAALVIVAQAAFLQQLPAIARQEIALLEFIALVAVLADRDLRTGPRRLLVVVFGTGLVVAHYSTAYATIGLLALGLVVAVALVVLRRRVRLLGPLAYAFAVVAVAAAAWYGPVTWSYGNAGDALQAIAADGLDVLPGAAGKAPLDAYLRGNTGGTLSAAEYEREVADRYARERPYVLPLEAGSEPQYRLRDDPVPAGGDASARRALDVSGTVAFQLINLLAAVGALTLALRRRSSRTARLVGALGVGALVILAIARVSGTVATSYNIERLNVQLLAVTAVGLAFLLDRAAARSIVGRVVAGLFVLGVAIALVVGTGLGSVLSGTTGTANLARSGEDYERFAITPGERDAAVWFGAHAPAGAQLYADRYGQLRLFAFARRGASFLNAVTPRTLDHHAWVYASRTNVADGRARDAIGANVATYGFPAAYLDARYDRLYVSQQGAVWAR